MYKKGINKKDFLGKMRNFWIIHWKYQHIETWLQSIDLILDADPEGTIWYNQVAKKEAENDLDLLNKAIDKLILERLLKKDNAKRLREFLKSSDEENRYLALSIMDTLKPNKFKKEK
jgi:hypothetical protein